MSPSTVDVTLCSSTRRAAAMLAKPAVRQEAIACSTNSIGVGAWSCPTRTAGWSASNVVTFLCSISWHRTVEVRKPRATVGATLPCVGGSELKLGDLLLILDGIECGK